MANNFSSESNCAALWSFEYGALGTDSKGTNTLSFNNSPAGTTVNYMEGAGAITMVAGSTQYAFITDTNLAAGFPLKSGDTTKLISVCCWVRPTTVDANKRRIWAKWYTTGNKKCLELYYNSTNVYMQYSANGSTGTEVNLGFGAMTANQWYHITLIVDGVNNTYRLNMYNATAGTDYMATGTIGGLYVSSASWRIGADDDLAANLYFDGQIDELIVFNRLLNSYEPYAIRGGLFPVTESWWHVDPVNGNNSYTGTTWAQAWKTFQHRFNAGDEIRIAKSTETAQAGTVTATTDSEVIQTTNNLSGTLVQYTLVRIGTDDTIYMVWASTSTTVTLNGPYRGTTGAGKSISLVTGFTKTTTSDWTKTSGDGTSSNPILVKGGYNTSTNTRDGFTVIDWAGTSTSIFNSFMTYWNFSNVFALYFTGSIWYSLIDGVLDNCGAFRNNRYYPIQFARRVTVNNFVCHVWAMYGCYDTIINDLHTGEPLYGAGFCFGYYCLNTTVNRWKNAGWNGMYSAINFQSAIVNNVTFVDAVFDVTGKGCKNFGCDNYSATFNNLNFFNPTISTGILFNQYGLSYNFVGEIGLQNVNGDPTDHRRIIALGSCSPAANLYPGVLQTDTSVYRTASPSAKLTLNQWTLPYRISHSVPCDANVPLTISAYLRKNSSYGSSTLPYMHLSWVTTPGLSFCTQDVAMSDVNDTFTQVSYTLTPGITGTIGVDFVFQSGVSGALAWYDDVEVS